MKKMGALTLMLLMLTGCFGDKETTTVCKSETNYGVQTETIDADGDKVTKYKAVLTQDLSEFIDTEKYTDKELEEKYAENTKIDYSNIKGVKYSLKIEKGILTETIEVDYTKADIAELTKKGLIVEQGKTVDYISLEKTVEASKKNKGKCEEK